MKKINNLLGKLENLANQSDEITPISEPFALQLKGGLNELNVPSQNGTCAGHNGTCNNSSCDGSSNDVCNGGCSAQA